MVRNTSITRTREELIIHHIDEDKVAGLSDSRNSINSPFGYQQAERLVYCNLLEHLVLHIKIFENQPSKDAIGYTLGIKGALNYIAPQLNDIYARISIKYSWELDIASKVWDLKHEYLQCIKKIVSFGISVDKVLKTSFYHLDQESKQKFNLFKSEVNTFLVQSNRPVLIPEKTESQEKTSSNRLAIFIGFLIFGLLVVAPIIIIITLIQN